MNPEIIKRLLAKLRCKNCGRAFQSESVGSVAVLGNLGDLWFFLVQCSGCASRAMVSALIYETGRPEIASDLSDTERGQACMSVDSDDVLDMHLFLEDFSGDFVSLFPR